MTTTGNVNETWPDVTVVVPTKNRPELLNRAVQSVLDQDYLGRIECLVVFDGTEPIAPDVSVSDDRTVRTMVNTRTPGLAGNRNTGYVAAVSPYVAACDDDDEWFADKLTTQMALLRSRPDSSGVGSGSTFHFEGKDTPRPADLDALTFDELLARRHPEVHASTYLFDRRRLVDEIGLVDEKLPAGYGEDFELLLRATRIGPFVCVRRPLIRAYQHRSSFFADRWRNIDDALAYLIDAVPEFQRAPEGLARMEGQRAFAKAALGERREAVRFAMRALRRSRRAKQAWAALFVASGVVRPGWILASARRAGRGI